MDQLGQWWQRAAAFGPPPEPPEMLALAAAALIAVLFAWRSLRLVVTICHEGGHALAALLTGRRVSAVRIHSDTSGETRSAGSGAGVLVLLAGYPAAAVGGLSTAALVMAGHAAAACWILAAALSLLLLWLRNGYGALVVFGCGTALFVASWFAGTTVLGWLAAGLAWLLLLAAPRPVLELFGNRSPGSDAARLAALTGVPRVVWLLGWLVVTVAALVLGAALLLGLWPR